MAWADQNSVINDPTMTPLIKQDGRCFVTHDGRILIARSSLRLRTRDATDGNLGKKWLTYAPLRRGGNRS